MRLGSNILCKETGRELLEGRRTNFTLCNATPGKSVQ